MSQNPPSPGTQPIVALRQVWKTYTLWNDAAGPLLAALRRVFRAGSSKADGRQFVAVRDVSFQVLPGECLGIVGRNGAGKSTLLQMIAGTVRPTRGDIRVGGRVAALLELGSGFNPDFTGRENIHLNASILGLGKAEIARKFDAIVDYSGLGEFIDQPVRTYSSGMALRLAFAVCVHVDADILIIDEALAVGDARFQFKCQATLDQMLKDGRTIIFVSHDTNALKRMCHTALLLERGEVLLQGSPNDVTNIYTKLLTSPHGIEAIRGDIEALRRQPPGGPDPQTAPRSSAHLTRDSAPAGAVRHLDDSIGAPGHPANLLAEERAHQQISDKEYSYGGEQGSITTVQLTDEGDTPRLSFVAGGRVRVRITCEARVTVPEPIYALTVKDIRGQEIFGTNTYFQSQTTKDVPAGTAVEAVFDLQLNVLPGVYFISLGWVRLENSEVIVVHRRYDVLRFDVLPRDRSFGLAYCPTEIRVRAIPP